LVFCFAFSYRLFTPRILTLDDIRRRQEGIDPLLQAEEGASETLHIPDVLRIQRSEVRSLRSVKSRDERSEIAAQESGSVGRYHGPGLFLFGDGDEGRTRDCMVPTAVVPDFLGELVEAQYLAQGRSRLADDVAQLLLGVIPLVHKGLKGLGLLDGGEILAEHVLDQGDLRGVALHTDAGDNRESGHLGRLVSAFAGNDDQGGDVVGRDAEQERLDDAVGLDRCSQFIQGLGVHAFSGLVGVRPEVGDGDVVELAFFIQRHLRASSRVFTEGNEGKKMYLDRIDGITRIISNRKGAKDPSTICRSYPGETTARRFHRAGGAGAKGVLVGSF